MGCLPIVPGSPRARGVNRICSKTAWCVVVLSFMLLLGDSSASQSRLFDIDHSSYDHCEGNTGLIANGVCDISVNTADCGFDGGDCCESTCVLEDGSPCDRAEAFFSCRDPDVPVDCDSTDAQTQRLTTTSNYSQCAGHIPHIRNGRCDEANNNAYCGFDGGDCCPSTCAGGLAYPCGDQGGGFDCRDRHAFSPRRRLITSRASCGGFTGSIGDTSCDIANNNLECGYDGGDCCECTCAPDLSDPNIGEVYWTNHCLEGNFDCLDPSANCGSDGDNPAPDPTPSPVYLWPGPSPPASPVASPTASPVTSPIARPVTSPTASPVPNPAPVPASSPTYITSSECGWPESYLGDGDCDAVTNNLACGWDGGDCCRCTCEDSYYYKCSELDFDCLEPYAPTDCDSDSSLTSSGSWTSPVPSPIYASTDSSVTSTGSETSPVPSPIYVSPEPSPTVRPVSSPIASPLPSPTARPVPTSGTTETSSERDSNPQSDSVPESDRSIGSDSPPPSDIFTGSDSAVGSDTPPPGDSLTASDLSVRSDSVVDEDSSAEGGDVGAEGASTSSASLTATTGSFIVSWEVVGVFSASVLGYYAS